MLDHAFHLSSASRRSATHRFVCKSAQSNARCKTLSLVLLTGLAMGPVAGLTGCVEQSRTERLVGADMRVGQNTAQFSSGNSAPTRFERQEPAYQPKKKKNWWWPF